MLKLLLLLLKLHGYRINASSVRKCGLSLTASVNSVESHLRVTRIMEGRYNRRNGMERRNGTNKSISCIMKVIQFAQYIQFQLTGEE